MNRSKRTFFLWLVSWFLGHDFSLLAKSAAADQASFVEKKEHVIRLYTKKRYARAHDLIEALLPLLTNRTDRSEMQFYQAYCNYHDKNYLGTNYLVSSDQFHLFVEQYPFSPRVEEAVFMRGYSLACKNVDIRLDQSVTFDAIRYLEQYEAAYPVGSYRDQTAAALQDLQKRLMKKSFGAAHLYVRLGHYNAAVVALKNFEQTYPDSPFQEIVLRLLVKSYEKLAMKALNAEKKQEMTSYASQFAQQLASYRNTIKHLPQR